MRTFELWRCPACGLADDSGVESESSECAGILALGTDHAPVARERITVVDTASLRASLPDPVSIRSLAAYLDVKHAAGTWPDTEVQDELRGWADRLERITEEPTTTEGGTR